jgi:predicted dehydrogenase
MGKEFRIGIIGFGHMHINDVGQSYHGNPGTKIVAFADTKPEIPELRVAPYTRAWNFQHAGELYPDAKPYDDYAAMLENENLDLAIITSEVLYHKKIVTACAKAGVDVCVEKPMAYDLADALAMAREVREHGTLLMVNWPVAWSAGGRELQRLAEAGAIGRVFQMRLRIGHSGPLGIGAKHAGVTDEAAPMTGYERAQTWWHRASMGGGAMLDYCCYGCLLAQWYIGQDAVSVMGMRANLNSEWGDAEDSAAMIVRFPSAMATLEGTWATFHQGLPGGPVLYGTEGTMLQTGEGIIVYSKDGSSHDYAVPGLPEGRASIAAEYVHHKTTGENPYILVDREYNLRAMAMLDAGLRSAASGKLESVNTSHWCIG